MKSSWPRKLNNWQNPKKILKKLNKEEKLLKNLSDKLRNKDKKIADEKRNLEERKAANELREQMA